MREDGSVEVYSDFIYVGQIYDEKNPCIDIEAGAFNFFFRSVQAKAIKITQDMERIRKAYKLRAYGAYNKPNFLDNNFHIILREDAPDTNLLTGNDSVKDVGYTLDKTNSNLIFMDPEELKDDDLKKLVAIRRVKKKWKNRIAKNTMQEEVILDGWEEVLHERVAPFLRLYTAMTNIATFMIVSHRNMISIFNMGEMDEAVDIENEKDKDQITSWVDTV